MTQHAVRPHQPPPIQGGAPMVYTYQTATQNSQYSPFIQTQNVHHTRAPGPLLHRGLGHLETIGGPLPYGTPVHLPPPPPPPPLTSAFYNSATYKSFVHSVGEGSHPVSIASPLPPPPPSSPPPLPSSPPPPTTQPPSSKNPESEVISSDSQIGNMQSNDNCSNRRDAKQDLPPPPPKPKDEKIVQNIDVLCRFISKNGPDFENMACQKEANNPEFKFLFGGESGSDAAIAHEYFSWMKTKYALERKLSEGHEQNDFSVASFERESLNSHDSLTGKDEVHSPADSDMDMEDDMIQSEKEVGFNNDVVKDESGLIHDKLGMREVIKAPPSPRDGSLAKDVLSGSISCNVSSELAKQERWSPLKLVQGYESDISEKSEDDTLKLENVSPVIVSPPIAAGSATFQTDKKENTSSSGEAGKTDNHSGNQTSSGVDKFTEVVKPQEEDAKDALPRGNQTSSGVAMFPKICKDKKEDQKDASSPLKVDEFGRLVREGNKDSDSASSEPRYTRRHNKRGISRSRSRSPHDRRRRRTRRERRSPSRSWSPKRRRRSRSRSPAYNRSRRDKKGSMPDCFDFLRGKCYRGSSCRYLHHEMGKVDGSRQHNKSRNQYREVSLSPKRSDFQEKIIETHDGNGRKLNADVDKSEKIESSVELVDLLTDMGKGQEQVVSHPPLSVSNDFDNKNLHGHTYLEAISVQKVEKQSQPYCTLPVLQNAGIPIKSESHDALISVSQPVSSDSPVYHPPGKLPPPPPIPPPVNVSNAQSNFNSLPLNLSFPFQPSPVESFPSYQVPYTNQFSNFTAPSMPRVPYLHPSTSNLGIPATANLGMPATANLVMPATANLGMHPLQVPQNQIPPRNEFPSLSQGGEFQHRIYPPMEDTRPYPSSRATHLNQPFGRPNIITNDQVQTFTSPFPPSPQNHPYINQQPSHDGVVMSRISTYYNPFASTFDQPLSSKFSANDPRQLSSSLNVTQAKGDQYDPLFDSIDPSSASKKEGEPVGSLSLSNDEFGETADAGVGIVENCSPSSNQIGTPNAAEGEIEVYDDSKKKGKVNKGKDSRSMKLFKVALADFVKEVLKPSWRQGNMSKEAFKTIVKKTVDKVSGAMKTHQIPKSQAKIDRYIDSSQRKLTKLVMGYVDKYVKV